MQLSSYVPTTFGQSTIRPQPNFLSRNHFRLKGSHKNKFAILSVEAPVWQGAKAQEYQDIPSFRNAAMRDGSALKM
jgi:hypothetical protein